MKIIKTIIASWGGRNLWLSVLVLPCFANQGWCSTASEMYRTKAVLDMYAGNHKHALEELNQALQADPKDYTALYYRGIAYTRIGNMEDAIKDIESAIKSGVDFEGLHFELGYAYFLNDNLNQAQAALEKAYLDYPKHAPAKYYLGLIYYLQGKYRQCIKPLSESVELDTTFGPSVAYLTGNAYIKLNRFKEAENVLASALTDYPDSLYNSATRELLVSITNKQNQMQRFFAQLTGGVAYDSNVGLLPDGQLPSDKTSAGDTGAYLRMDAKYKVYAARRQWVKLGYQYFVNKHSKLSEFDLDRHVLSVDLRDKHSRFTWGLTYEYARTNRDNKDFMESTNFMPNLLVSFGENYFSLATFQILDTNYRQTSLEQRNSYFYELLYRIYYAAKKEALPRYFIGLRAGKDNAADNEYDYTGYAIEAGYERKLFGGDLYGLIRYGERKYSESVISRKNQHTELNLSYTFPLTNSLEVEGAGVYVDNPSNDSNYNYNRYVLSALLRWKL
jgi:Tfp pilus assembly protein PilF